MRRYCIGGYPHNAAESIVNFKASATTGPQVSNVNRASFYCNLTYRKSRYLSHPSYDIVSLLYKRRG